jgi:hypothetical protein
MATARSCRVRRLAKRVAAGIVIASFTLASGCSLVFVRPPKRDRAGQLQPVRCTASRAAPIVDTVIATAALFSIGLAFSRTDADYEDSATTRQSDVVGGAVSLALFGLSAAYGIASTGVCRRLRAHATGTPPRAPNQQAPASQSSDEDEEEDEDAVEERRAP